MKKYRVVSVFLIALFAISACMPTPTPVFVSVETIVAATYAAISAQTEAARPPATPIPPTPTNTRPPATITPTPTATFVISSPTPSLTVTPSPEPTSTNISSGSGTVLYACDIVGLSPESGVIVKPGEEFKWIWRVTNIGTTAWRPETTFAVYKSGSAFYVKKEVQLGEPASIGETIQVIIKMRAPKETGTYTTTWSLHKGIHDFCYADLRIVVLK